LREAAFTLECWRDERANTEYAAPHWDAPYEQYEAVAALLRAVADESEVCWCGPEYTERGLSRPGCPAHDVMTASADAALVLADTILGSGDG
jgi:hypothetical protein